MDENTRRFAFYREMSREIFSFELKINSKFLKSTLSLPIFIRASYKLTVFKSLTQN